MKKSMGVIAIVLFFSQSLLASSRFARSCDIDGNQGGGQMDITTYGGGELYVRAKENGDGHLSLALSRAFLDLGVIGPFELISAFAYTPLAKNCRINETLGFVSCQENHAEISVTVVTTDNQGTTRERHRNVTLDGASFELSVQQGFGKWRWSFQKGDKATYVPALDVFGCLLERAG